MALPPQATSTNVPRTKPIAIRVMGPKSRVMAPRVKCVNDNRPQLQPVHSFVESGGN